jgi:hypothetical protein
MLKRLLLAYSWKLFADEHINDSRAAERHRPAQEPLPSLLLAFMCLYWRLSRRFACPEPGSEGFHAPSWGIFLVALIDSLTGIVVKLCAGRGRAVPLICFSEVMTLILYRRAPKSVSPVFRASVFKVILKSKKCGVKHLWIKLLRTLTLD